MKDHLIKATANGVRMYAAVTTKLVNEGIRRHQCNPVAAAALGRTMTGALLMAANLKNKECITVKFNGDGPLGNVVADASPDGYVRGYVDHPYVDLPLNNGKLAVGEGIGAGIVLVTRFTGLRDTVTGTCRIATGEIAEDLTRYLYVSEQTPSSIGLGVLVGKDLKAIAAGGFFIQPMPGLADEVLTKLEKNLAELRPVSEMIGEGLDGRGIIAEVLKGFDTKYFETIDLTFKCQCSKQRIEGILLSLNEKELESLVEDGHAEVCCHFCGEKYQFNKDELVALINVSKELKKRKNE
jgi:molecular chaperone Hsp33